MTETTTTGLTPLIGVALGCPGMNRLPIVQ